MTTYVLKGGGLFLVKRWSHVWTIRRRLFQKIAVDWPQCTSSNKYRGLTWSPTAFLAFGRNRKVPVIYDTISFLKTKTFIFCKEDGRRWCHMTPKKSSRQKYYEYHELWLLRDSSRLFIAVNDYMTIVYKFPCLQPIYSFIKVTTLTKTCSTEKIPQYHFWVHLAQLEYAFTQLALDTEDIFCSQQKCFSPVTYDTLLLSKMKPSSFE